MEELWKVAMFLQSTALIQELCHDLLHVDTQRKTCRRRKAIPQNQRLKEAHVLLAGGLCSLRRPRIRVSLTTLGIRAALTPRWPEALCILKGPSSTSRLEATPTHPPRHVLVSSHLSITNTPPSIYIKPSPVLSIQSSSTHSTPPRLLHAVSSLHPLQLRK